MMKYQKAIEKAKQERGRATETLVIDSELEAVEADDLPIEASEVNLPERAAAQDVRDRAPARKGADGWSAPVYTHSRTVKRNAAAAARNRCICLTPDAPEQDYYKVLRTQLTQRMKPKGWNMLMVTSVCPGEGKSLTTVNLGVVMAKSYNQTVLVVDCDLRRQSIWRYLGLSGERGIVDYLVDGRELSELIVWPEIEKMTLISGGRITGDSAELLGSPRMRELMTELKGRYADRFVIVDAPPLLGGADTMVLAQYVDGIVVVVESGKTPLKQIQNAMELVPREKFLGFVLNKSTEANSAHYKRYQERSHSR